jgi:glucosamine--fructose-6-phosphate aminotransferase (isomerizing)
VARLAPVRNLYVIGRGLGLGVAQEAALKFKETCGLHAEALSAAELRHGPMALVRAGFPLLLFTQNDESRAGITQLAAELAAQGAEVLLAGARVARTTELPTEGAHPVIEPLLFAQSFYRMANALSLARGHDPDAPPHLRKVTETL